MSELVPVLLPVLPLLLLLVALLFGRYPGCEAIVRLAARIAARSHRAHAAAAGHTRPRAPRSFAPGGGLLLALSLSGRGPPA